MLCGGHGNLLFESRRKVAQNGVIPNHLPRLLLFCVLLAGHAAAGLALDRNRLLTQYVHDRWTTSEGLPQDSVNAIAQTSDGYLWIATQEGLARFDGIRFTVFDSRATGGVLTNFVHTLFTDRAGTLWIGASGGLLRYAGNGKFVRYGEEIGWPDTSARSISEDAAGNLWVGLGSEGTSGRKGLLRFKDGQLKTFTIDGDPAGNQVLDTCPDREGNIWFGTASGLRVMRNGTLTNYTTAAGLADNFVRAVRVDRTGAVWAGTPRGLSVLRNGKFTTYTTKDGLSNDSIRAITEDRDGTIWIGTARGLNRFSQEGKIEAAPSPSGIAEDQIMDVFEDREGSLWIGTHSNGLQRLRAGRFTPFGSPEGLLGDSANGIFEDRAGRIWIGTSPGGVTVLDQGRVRTFSVRDGLSNHTARMLLEDRRGDVWIGTNDGLNRLRAGRLTAYTTRDGLPSNNLLSGYEDRQGTLWFGTDSGLARLDGGRFLRVDIPHGPAAIRLIREDRSGRLWIGGGDGVGYLRGGTFTPEPRLATANVHAMHEDADGTLWLTTWGQGLHRLAGTKLTSYSTAHGLYDDVAWSILADGAGNFWMGSNRGIYRVPKQQLDDVAAGKRKTVACTVYGTADGMRKRETNAGSPPALRSRDGRLWFATTGGVVVIDPKNIRMNDVAPPVVLERVVADEKPIPLDSSIVLEPGTRSIEFHYAALSLISPQKVQYKYRLAGYDDHWIDAGTRRSAYYTNIDPGAYRFEVIAANDDGVWNETGASIPFRLRPYFRQTRWFYALAVIALILVGVALDSWRERQRRMRHQAFHDPLTGLANRMLLARRSEAALATSIKRARPLAILFLDLDRFKIVNDGHGHEAGDRLLEQVASRFRTCIGPGDTLARIGGDEFAVLLADLDQGPPEAVAQRMLDCMRDPFVVEDQTVSLGVSIGIARHPEDGADVKTILQAADRAMYRAKLAGGNVMSSRA